MNMTKINTLSRALPRCDLTQSSGDILILDRHAEVIGRVDLEKAKIYVFDTYEHRKKVLKRLKRAGLPCSYEDPTAGALKVLYDTPDLSGSNFNQKLK